MATRKVDVIHNTDANRFEVDLDGFTALSAYHIGSGRIVFTHTEVPYQFREQGIAGQIVHAGLEYAREQGLSVVPLCAYVADYIRRHPEYQSLVVAP